jgi:peroxiredoxin
MYAHERSLVEEMKNEPFTLFGINSDDSPEGVRSAMAREKLTWPILCAGSTEGVVPIQWGVTSWPSLWVLDAKGVIRYRDLRGEELTSAVKELVAEAKAGK